MSKNFDKMVKGIIEDNLSEENVEIAFKVYKCFPLAVPLSELLQNPIPDISVFKGLLTENALPNGKAYKFNMENCRIFLYTFELKSYIQSNFGTKTYQVAKFLLNEMRGSVMTISEGTGLKPEAVRTELNRLNKLKLLISITEDEEQKSLPKKADKANTRKQSKVRNEFTSIETTLYELNKNQLMKDVISLKLFNYLNERIGIQAATIIFAILRDLNYKSYKFTLTQCINAAKPALLIEEQEVEFILDSLASDGLYLSKGENWYEVKFPVIVEELKEKRISELVRTKYGLNFERVYKVAIRKGPCTKNELINSILLPQEEIKECLEVFMKEKVIKHNEEDLLVLNYEELKERFILLLYDTISEYLNKRRMTASNELERTEMTKAINELANHLMILIEL